MMESMDLVTYNKPSKLVAVMIKRFEKIGRFKLNKVPGTISSVTTASDIIFSVQLDSVSVLPVFPLGKVGPVSEGLLQLPSGLVHMTS